MVRQFKELKAKLELILPDGELADPDEKKEGRKAIITKALTK